MTKIYRYGLLLVAITVAALSLSSCAPDDDGPEAYIIGDWYMVAPLGDIYNEFTFYSNGTGSYYVEDAWGADEYYIEWYTSGNSLTIDFPYDYDQMYFQWQCNGDVLYLQPSTGGPTWVYNRY